MNERYKDLKLAEQGARLSMVAYVTLSFAKLFIGNAFGSAALSADGLNNFTDVISTVAVMIGLRIARRPADEDHPYGHWKAETIASLATSLLMLLVGLQVLFSSFSKLTSGEFTTPDVLSGVTALIAGFIMIGVYVYNSRLANRINSLGLAASAKDNLSDALTSFATAIAIFGSIFGLYWLDGVMAVIVGIVIIKTAIDIFRESAFSLSDGFETNHLTEYRQAILEIPDVQQVTTIAARSYGANVYVDVTILLDPELTVLRSHEITEEVEERLRTAFDVFEIDVHVEPLTH
ncbi:cation diffusion facilitator family transporter [uncultured Trichococcus sp.]|uniref:cation diffusion facilitator family transporter n=1 Tax=uncultured Trichococcus sp. TaxID=189665 RepID=UPI0029C705B2|nr:cation diffusion facilitator family transporter [uncultured Trichococcus sp.]